MPMKLLTCCYGTCTGGAHGPKTLDGIQKCINANGGSGGNQGGGWFGGFKNSDLDLRQPATGPPRPARPRPGRKGTGTCCSVCPCKVLACCDNCDLCSTGKLSARGDVPFQGATSIRLLDETGGVVVVSQQDIIDLLKASVATWGMSNVRNLLAAIGGK